jgi:glyoxylate/hydroxypyruvate reductase A
MKTVLVAVRSQPEEWSRLLQAALPDHRVATNVAGDAPSHYAVVGKPDPGFLQTLKEIEVIFSINAGVEHLLKDKTIPEELPLVRLVDPAMTEGMVEWVCAQTLAWHRNLWHYHELQHKRVWKARNEKTARDRVVTVLGAGALGGAVGRQLAALGFKVRMWGRSRRNSETGIDRYHGVDDLSQAVRGADVLVNLLPLTSETADILDRDIFAQLGDGAFVINAARGGHLVDDDLIAALDDDKLSGAALDVFRQEPLPDDHPFWSHPKIRISPHAAAQTYRDSAVQVIAANILRYERGEPLQDLVDRQRGY